VGEILKEGAIGVLESTVYPGVTKEVVGPILEQDSGKRCGKGFCWVLPGEDQPE